MLQVGYHIQDMFKTQNSILIWGYIIKWLYWIAVAQGYCSTNRKTRRTTHVKTFLVGRTIMCGSAADRRTQQILHAFLPLLAGSRHLFCHTQIHPSEKEGHKEGSSLRTLFSNPPSDSIDAGLLKIIWVMLLYIVFV